MQKSIEKTMHLGIDFWRDFGGFLEAKWRHVGTKIDQKSMPTWKSDFLKKPCFSLGKTKFFQKIALRSWHRFLIDFGANMPPFFLQKFTKILPKIDPKMHHFSDRFWHRFLIDFESILEANLEPCRPHFRRKWGDPIVRPPLFCWIYVIF